MRRGIISLFIVGYLGALLAGLGSHLLQYGRFSHPAMYFVVWDMFESWGPFEPRTHIMGQGISGEYYELSPGPWGGLHPHGSIDRQHFDSAGLYTMSLANCTLRHTEHEPMARIFLVEECWSRRFNLSDELQTRLVGRADEPTSYFHLKQMWDADGTMLAANASWFTQLQHHDVMLNPRLHRENPSSGIVSFPLVSQWRNATGQTTRGLR